MVRADRFWGIDHRTGQEFLELSSSPAAHLRSRPSSLQLDACLAEWMTKAMVLFRLPPLDWMWMPVLLPPG